MLAPRLLVRTTGLTEPLVWGGRTQDADVELMLLNERQGVPPTVMLVAPPKSVPVIYMSPVFQLVVGEIRVMMGIGGTKLAVAVKTTVFRYVPEVTVLSRLAAKVTFVLLSCPGALVSAIVFGVDSGGMAEKVVGEVASE